MVAVLPADNVEIVPDSQATTGLLRQQAAVPLELPLRQQEPLFYRSDAPKAVFAAELRRHRQKITAGVASRVTLDAAAVRVEQKFAYSIAYEPTDYFLLEVPRELSAKGRLVLNYEDQVLAPVVLGEEADDGVKPLRMRVALPKACIGPCEITARYALAAGGRCRRREHPRAAGHAAGRGTCRQQRLGHCRGPSSKSKSLPASGRRSRADWARPASPRTREFAAAATHRGNRAQAARRKRRRCGRGGRPGVDPDLRDQIGCRRAPGPRRAAIHHAAARTGDHAARRGRPRQASVQLNGGPSRPRTRDERVLIVPLSADTTVRSPPPPTCSACNIISPDRGRARLPGER